MGIFLKGLRRGNGREEEVEVELKREPQLLFKDFIFTEQDTPGTYSANFDVSEGTTIVDILLIPVIPSGESDVDSGSPSWNADNAQISIGDIIGGAGAYYDSYDVKSVFYNLTDAQRAGDGPRSVSMANSEGTVYTYGTWFDNEATNGGVGIIYPVDDRITMILVTTGPVNGDQGQGKLRVRILYIPPVDSIEAEFE